MSKIKLVIFDLWHTLAYRELSYSTSRKMWGKVETDIPYKVFKEAIFRETLQTKDWKTHEDKYNSYKELAKEMGAETNEETVKLLMNIRDKAEATTKLYDSAIPLIKKLRNNGYEIGLLSNSPPSSKKVIKERTELLKYIDYPLFSFEVGRVKPDPYIYYKMLKRTGYKPEEVLMIGDNEFHDIVAPKEVGIHAIHFKNYKKLKKDLKKLGVKL